MMIERLIFNIVPIIVTAFVTWFFARRKNRQQVKAMAIDNEIRSANYYQELLDDMASRLTQAVKELVDLENRYRDVLRHNEELMEGIKKLQEVNNELIGELRKFKQLNGKKK